VVNTRRDELVWVRNQLEAEGNDLLRELVRSFAQGLMSAEAKCGLWRCLGEARVVCYWRSRPPSITRAWPFT